MSENDYLFIDGGYAREEYRRAMHRVFGVEAEPDPLRLCTFMKYYFRTYFYDCLDDRRLDGEAESDYQARVGKMQSYFDEFSALRGVHVRLGTVVGKRPRQKEVDILLAVDMLTHGFARNMSHAALLAGDLDFRPVVNALVRAGVFVQVLYVKNSASKELYGAADFGIPLDWRTLHNWGSESFKLAHPVPKEMSNVPDGGETVKTGRTASGDSIMLYSRSPKSYLMSVNNSSQFVLEHDDRGVLEKYYCAVHEKTIEWSGR